MFLGERKLCLLTIVSTISQSGFTFVSALGLVGIDTVMCRMSMVIVLSS